MLQSFETKSPLEKDKIKRHCLVFFDKCLEYLNVLFDDCELILEDLNLQEKMSVKMKSLQNKIL